MQLGGVLRVCEYLSPVTWSNFLHRRDQAAIGAVDNNKLQVTGTGSRGATRRAWIICSLLTGEKATDAQLQSDPAATVVHM